MKGAISFVILILIATVVVSGVIYTYSASIEKQSISQRAITGRAVSDIPATAPSECKTYYGDDVCDAPKAECPEGTFVTTGNYPSVPECNECQTGGFGCSKILAKQTTTPSINQNCPNKQGSCQGKCGQYIAAEKCGCDDLCTSYSDCYPDYQSVCEMGIETVSTSGLPNYCGSYGSKSDIYCDDTDDKCNSGYVKGTSAPECKECSIGKWLDCRVICDEDNCIDFTKFHDHAYIERPLETSDSSFFTGAAVAIPPEKELDPKFYVQPILFVPKDVEGKYPSGKYFLTAKDPLLEDPLIKSLNAEIEIAKNFYKKQIGKLFLVNRFIIVRGDGNVGDYLCNFKPYKPGSQDCSLFNIGRNIMLELVQKRNLHYNPLRIDLIFPVEPATFGGESGSLGIPFIFSEAKLIPDERLGTNWAIVRTAPTKASIYGCNSLKDLLFSDIVTNSKYFCNFLIKHFNKISKNYNLNLKFDAKLIFMHVGSNQIIHELGHLFGLPHPDEAFQYYGYKVLSESKEYGTTPMGAVTVNMNAVLSTISTEFKYEFLPQEKEILLNSPFFKYGQN